VECGFGSCVWAWLEACVAYVFLVCEVILLGEVEAAFVGCVCDVHWEGYLVEWGAAVAHAPADAN
jgi:hypothetical protein